jgi:altronate hydrolase
MQSVIRLNPSDNVAVALRPLTRGASASEITLRDDIAPGHKFALDQIRAGAPVIKYGYPIGLATADIAAGQHVHLHNLQSALDEVVGPSTSGISNRNSEISNLTSEISNLTFDGFPRPDGRVGIRNEIWVINTVACVNQAAQQIASAAARDLALSNLGVDGVYTFPHPFGCSQLGDDLDRTQQVLTGLVRHPNAAAVLILGLGCENNRLAAFLEKLGPVDRDRVRFFNAQEVSDEIDAGVEAVGALADYASTFKRTPTPVSELIVGAKCGGSDGFSGITANPLVGLVSDRLTRAGATVLLTEVPEMFGAEPVLLQRAADATVAKSIVDLVNDFRRYFRSHDQPIDENPAPGNKDGGITTLAEKSLGCVQKGGSAPVRAVLPYGAQASPHTAGVALVNAPGNDGVSGTALTIAGANLLLFTTGRGTPMGFPAPTIKISTNSDLASRKPRWIDFDAGRLLSDSATSEDLADELTNLLVDVASGRRQTRTEQNGCREIAIWKTGVTV